ncbi:MAG: Flp pilus assembly complex ATPase component TadA [Planctomycetes bacterium]|nr:Flp pilus assembly complex ATPase component TadA [Planctomycetota bacterium]
MPDHGTGDELADGSVRVGHLQGGEEQTELRIGIGLPGRSAGTAPGQAIVPLADGRLEGTGGQDRGDGGTSLQGVEAPTAFGAAAPGNQGDEPQGDAQHQRPPIHGGRTVPRALGAVKACALTVPIDGRYTSRGIARGGNDLRLARGVPALSRPLLGEILVKRGVCTPEQVEEALAYQKEKGCKIGEALVKLKHVTPMDVTRALAKQFALPFVDLGKLEIPQDVVESVPRSVITEHNIVPIQKKKRSIVIATSDPLDFYALDNLRFILNTEVEPVLATKEAVRNAISQYYGMVNDLDAVIDDLTSSEIELRGDALGDEKVEEEDEDAPVIRLVQLIITEAIKKRASDVHIEPMAGKLRIRYRIDGVCVEQDSPPKKLQGAIISRVKIMAGMDMAEKRRPQDGRINMTIAGRAVDFRVNALPSRHGESVVLRILDKEKALVTLDKLGFEERNYQQFQKIIKRPNGIFLVTGPTGSGKTTTLYAALQELNRPDVKIITAENPVEYAIAGINQSEVKHKIGLDFSRILRSMLRQAPNIVLVGEIRDEETAKIAIEAALTGHLVFSTLHTNDAPSSITRLIDMGVKPFLVSSAVLAIMAQRLIRVLCQKCKQPVQPEETELKMVGLAPQAVGNRTIYGPVGCEECNGTGYRGRKGVYELMEMNTELRDLAFKKAPTDHLRAAAVRSGMATLQQDACRKVLMGVTTLDEVLRITHQADLAL